MFSRFSNPGSITKTFITVLYPTTFPRFSNNSTFLKLTFFCFVPYDILKVIKQEARKLCGWSVLCPTTFSRFSNYAATLAVHLSFLYPTTFSRFSIRYSAFLVQPIVSHPTNLSSFSILPRKPWRAQYTKQARSSPKHMPCLICILPYKDILVNLIPSSPTSSKPSSSPGKLSSPHKQKNNPLAF